jgi:antitoxin (DNA-binding transcriptional repressor) of toxin-antitoxin stability system
MVMSSHIISATEAGRSLSSILNKVHYRGESYEIKRGKEIIAKIIPVEHKRSGFKIEQLNEFFKNLPALEEAELACFEKDLQKIRRQVKPEKDPWA